MESGGLCPIRLRGLEENNGFFQIYNLISHKGTTNLIKSYQCYNFFTTKLSLKAPLFGGRIVTIVTTP